MNDGLFPCRECGYRASVPASVAAYFTCGNCLEGRTPLMRELEKAKELLARAHGILEIGGPPAKKLPGEIADFLGWAREHDVKQRRAAATKGGE